MKLLKDGKKVIANNLRGLSMPINGMYVTYGTSKETLAPDADYDYFNDRSGALKMRSSASSRNRASTAARIF